jgi:hypothetical protein
MSGGAPWCLPVKARNINVRALHRRGQVHCLLQAVLDLIRRTNDGNHVVILVCWQKNGAPSLFEELVCGHSSLSDDELVATALDSELLQLELAVKLLDSPLDLGTSSQNSSPITGKLDVVLIVRWREDRLLASSLRWASNPGLVSRYSHLDTLVCLQIMDEAVVPAGNERVEFSGDTLDFCIDVRSSLTYNTVDFLLSESDGMRVTLELDLDIFLVVTVINLWLAIFDLRQLDAGTSLFLNGLDC